MSQLPARFALLLGNFVIGIAVLGLAGMLADLARGLHVTIPQAGLLMTAGAIVLALGAPLMVWATSRFDRRSLLAASLGVVALGHFASAFAPDYSALLALRVFILACAAVFTPTAASTVALLGARDEQPGAIAFVFLGYSVAMAAGLPAVGWLCPQGCTVRRSRSPAGPRWHATASCSACCCSPPCSCPVSSRSSPTSARC